MQRWHHLLKMKRGIAPQPGFGHLHGLLRPTNLDEMTAGLRHCARLASKMGQSDLANFGLANAYLKEF